MLRTRRSRLRQTKGNELIEFALVSVLLLVPIFVGTVEIGRAYYTYNILTKSVRNAARYLSASQMSPSGVVPGAYVANARALAMYGNVTGAGAKILPDLNSSDITVSGTASPGPSANEFYVTVSADYPYSPIFGLILSSVTFRPKVTMVFVGVITGT
jgi:Flp pilus assembly protein TadG